MKRGDFRIFQGYIARFDGTGKQGKSKFNILAMLFSSGDVVVGYYYGCGEELTLNFVLGNKYITLCKDKSFIKEALEFLVLNRNWL